jgi:hypothetical protein
MGKDLDLILPNYLSFTRTNMLLRLMVILKFIASYEVDTVTVVSLVCET